MILENILLVEDVKRIILLLQKDIAVMVLKSLNFQKTEPDEPT